MNHNLLASSPVYSSAVVQYLKKIIPKIRKGQGRQKGGSSYTYNIYLAYTFQLNS